MNEREQLIFNILEKVNKTTIQNLELINITIDGILGTYREEIKNEKR